MTERNRKILLLGVLVVVALIALSNFSGGSGASSRETSVRGMPTSGGGGTSRAAGSRGRRGANQPVTNVERLTSLDAAEPRSEFRPGRNPFSFYTPPPPPPPPRPPVRQVVQPRPVNPQPVVPVNVEPPKPQPPPFTMKYLGNFGPKRQKIAVFEDGENILNAKVGDVLDGKFRVADIGLESVTISFVDFPDHPAEQLPVGQ